MAKKNHNIVMYYSPNKINKLTQNRKNVILFNVSSSFQMWSPDQQHHFGELVKVYIEPSP